MSPPRPKHIKLVLEYDGTNFSGWQKQPAFRTVQGELEKAIINVSGIPSRVTGAGRTDTGVHARGQVANFKTNSRLSPQDWIQALNHYLPQDLVVLSARRVTAVFHARFSAVGKTYTYRISNNKIPSALGRDYVWQYYPPLNIRAMRAGTRFIQGRHDFSSFQVDRSGKIKKGGSPSAVCTLREVKISLRGSRVIFTFTGNRFLQHMVRSIVGTLLEVGRGRIKPREISEIIKKKDRKFAGPTVPARGLCLERVLYS